MPKLIKKNIRYAFFDVDDTVINAKSMFTFINMYFENNSLKKENENFTKEMKKLFLKDEKWEKINSKYYSYFKDFLVTDVKKTSLDWFSKNTTKRNDFYHKNIIKTIKEHQSNGIECVFVSGSFKELLQPIADDLGVKHILSINLERKEGKYTGSIIPPQTIGIGKADAMRLFMENKESHLSDCYAYGDDISDVPMLEIVGHPTAVTGGRRLESYAKEQGWPTINPN